MGTIDDIRAKLDIVDLVSQYVHLQKAGRNFKALCPFHSERTPSFIVSPERQTWRCFGSCGTGGDAFSFMMKRESIEFSEALGLLAERTGVQLKPRDSEREDSSALLYKINDSAASYFHHLLQSSPEAEDARGYLKQRGFFKETIENFQLGYSPSDGGMLLKHLKAQGYSREDSLAAGLATKPEAGGIKDLFRGRLMFTIRDQRGRTLGFGGRALGETWPKYINSPKTPIFDKSGILYGIDRAKNAIRQDKWAVVVEGYTDVLTAHQHGFKNVVASMGTSLTERQVDALKRLSTRVSMAMDADTAGQEATLRSLKSSWKALHRNVHPIRGRGRQRYLEGPPQQTIEVVIMPPGKDPDNVIRESDQEWSTLLENSKPLLDYIMEAEVARVNLEAPGARGAILEEFRGLLVTADFLDQDRYVLKLAKLLGVSEDSIKLTLRQAPRASEPRPSVRPRETAGDALESTGKQPEDVLGEDVLEEYVLALLMQRPELKELARGTSPDVFKHPENRDIFLRCVHGDGLEESLSERSGPDHLAQRLEQLSGKDIPEEPGDKLRDGLIECLNRLEVRRLKDLKTEEAHILSQEESLGEIADGIQRSAPERNAQIRELERRGHKAVQ
ncbi:MAG: DNA primase [Chloroflexi bacterium]|nr:DNA primase [Chloroflexota bacterium]